MMHISTQFSFHRINMSFRHLLLFHTEIGVIMKRFLSHYDQLIKKKYSSLWS